MSDATCLMCGGELVVASVGRPRLYCSDVCRQRRRRALQKQTGARVEPETASSVTNRDGGGPAAWALLVAEMHDTLSALARTPHGMPGALVARAVRTSARLSREFTRRQLLAAIAPTATAERDVEAS